MAETVKGTIGLTKREGIAGAGIGEHPLTIWLVTAIVIIYLYIRRSHLGIDTHPAEKLIIKPKGPLPTVTIPGVSQVQRLPSA